MESPEFQGAVKDLDSALKGLANKQAAQEAGSNRLDPATEAALRELLLRQQEARQSIQRSGTTEDTQPSAPGFRHWAIVGAIALVAAFALLGVGLYLGRQLARRTLNDKQASSQPRPQSVVIQSSGGAGPQQPTVSPPVSSGLSEGTIPIEELDRRGNLGRSVTATIQGFRRVNWEAVFPWRSAFTDKPWDLLWVRWLLLFGLFPSVASILCGEQDDMKPLATICIAGYVALFWALGLRSIVKPSPGPASLAVVVLSAPVVIFSSLLLLGIRVDWLNKVFAATASYSASWRIVPLFLVWGIAQAIVAGALLWGQQRGSGATRLLYLGALSGMALAASPALAHYCDHDWFGSYRGTSLGAFEALPLPSLLSSMVAGLFTGGILAAVISIAKADPLHARQISVVGVFVAALVMTLNSVALTTLAHPFVVAASAFGLVAYIRQMSQAAKASKSTLD